MNINGKKVVTPDVAIWAIALLFRHTHIVRKLTFLGVQKCGCVGIGYSRKKVIRSQSATAGQSINVSRDLLAFPSQVHYFRVSQRALLVRLELSFQMVLVSPPRSFERPRLGSSSAPSRPSASRRVPRLESPSRGHHRPVEHVSRASDAGKGTLVEGDREGTITIAFAPHLYETTAELSSEHRFVTACSREDQQSLAHLSRCRDDRAGQPLCAEFAHMVIVLLAFLTKKRAQTKEAC